MKKTFLAFLMILTFACDVKEKPPEGLMTEQEMIDFLIDLQIVEAKINTSRLPRDSIKYFFPQIEKELFKKHGIQDSVYFQSYQYYLKNIERMEIIYSAVVDSLSLRERMLNTN